MPVIPEDQISMVSFQKALHSSALGNVLGDPRGRPLQQLTKQNHPQCLIVSLLSLCHMKKRSAGRTCHCLFHVYPTEAEASIGCVRVCLGWIYNLL